MALAMQRMEYKKESLSRDDSFAASRFFGAKKSSVGVGDGVGVGSANVETFRVKIFC